MYYTESKNISFSSLPSKTENVCMYYTESKKYII